ncbi:hypothetical protein ACFSHQ_06310 [Gemmobacter lanyuensis]
MIYRRPIQIEFNHCDPAGIVFYPRYFEMTNSVIENFLPRCCTIPLRASIWRNTPGCPL